MLTFSVGCWPSTSVKSTHIPTADSPVGPFSIDKFRSLYMKQLPWYNARVHNLQAVGMNRLGHWKQLHQSIILPHLPGPCKSEVGVSIGYSDHSMVATSAMAAMVQHIIEHDYSYTETRLKPGTFLKWGPGIEPLKNHTWNIFAFTICGKRDSARRFGANRPVVG